MERNKKIGAIVLKKIRVGESNIGLTILTEENVVLFVMAFGATKTKSKLFGATNIFVEGNWDLYYDPVKDHWRVKEVSVINYNQDIHLSIENFYTSSFLCEIILKSQGSDGVYVLLNKALKLFQNGENREYVLIQFLLRFLKHQGVLSSFNYCSDCGTEIVKNSLYYTGTDGLVCSSCLKGGRFIELSPGATIFCNKTLDMDFEASLRIGLDKSSLSMIKHFLITLIKKHTEGKLLTLESCDGLI